MDKKQYVGRGWENAQLNLINIQLKLEDLKNLNTDQYGYIKLVVTRLKSQDIKSKATHTVYVNTYNPQKGNNGAKNHSAEDNRKDLPF